MKPGMPVLYILLQALEYIKELFSQPFLVVLIWCNIIGTLSLYCGQEIC